MGQLRFRSAFGAVIAVLIAWAPLLAAQAPVAPSPEVTCLIWPFQNRSGDATLDWIGESFVTSLQQSLRGTDIAVLTRDQRERALELAGVPPQAPLSHAGLIRAAGQADARWLVVGWYDYDGNQFSAAASVIDLKREHLVPLAAQSGPLDGLEAVQARLAWAVRQRLAPGGEEPAASPPLPLSAYESYVRSQLETSATARLSDLEVAVHFAPDDARVLLALGEAELDGKHEAAALDTLKKVPETAAQYPEAQFTAGLAAYRLRQFQQAATIFTALEARWPLPSVVANLALAKSAASARNASAVPPASKLNPDFPLDSFLQLQRTVARFNAAKLDDLSPAERVSTELSEGQRLLDQKAWDGAAQNFTRVLAPDSSATPVQTAAAHAGLAAVWTARHNPAQAAAEVKAALAADPNNTAALALQKASAAR